MFTHRYLYIVLYLYIHIYIVLHKLGEGAGEFLLGRFLYWVGGFLARAGFLCVYT